MTDPTPNSLKPMPLSPAAQAVMDAWVENTLYAPIDNEPLALAAALCAAANLIAPTKQNYSEASDLLFATCLNGMAYAANELRLIATELRNHQ